MRSTVSFAHCYENRLPERGREEYHRCCRTSIRLRPPPCKSDSSSTSCPSYGEAFRGKSVSANTVQSDVQRAIPPRKRFRTIQERLGSIVNGIAHIEGKHQTRTRTTHRIDSQLGPVGRRNHRRRNTRHLHSLLVGRPVRRSNSPAGKRARCGRAHLSS